MHYSSCLKPKKIVNPYTHEEVYVPCRKCAACRNKVAYNWVIRLEQERKCWKYTFFVTLKYDEQHLPCLKRRFTVLPETDRLPEDYRVELYDEVNDYLVTLHTEDFFGWQKKDYDFFNETTKFNYPNTKLIQKFIKLLRYYANEEDEEATLRYFVASELGPTTFRLHHHGLFFTNSQKVCEEFGNLLSKTWKNGSFSYELVESSASSYVAAYVNATSNLPAIYRVNHIAPKTWMSRRPPLGSLVFKSEEVQRLFDSASPIFTLYESKGNKYFNVPLWRCFKDRLYPKLPLFNKLPDDFRKSIYGLVEREDCSDYDKFFFFAKRCVEEGNDLGRYFAAIKRPCDVDIIDKFTSWKRVFDISKRVRAQRAVFGVSLNYYVEQISNFYANEEKFKLNSQLQFSAKQSELQELPYLLNLDRILFDKFLSSDFESLDTKTKSLLSSYGVDVYNYEFLDYYDWKNTFDFKNFKFLQEKIFKDNVKNKLKNDYLERNKEKFKNVYHFIYGTT